MATPTTGQSQHLQERGQAGGCGRREGARTTAGEEAASLSRTKALHWLWPLRGHQWVRRMQGLARGLPWGACSLVQGSMVLVPEGLR